jgi:hypothetical protein
MARALGIRFLDGSRAKRSAKGERRCSGWRGSMPEASIRAWRPVDCVGLDRRLTTRSAGRRARAPRSVHRRAHRPRTSGTSITRSGISPAVAYRDLGLDLQHEPGAGAAGGVGFGLLAFCGGHRSRSGRATVMEAVGFDDELRGGGSGHHGGGNLR